jgi:Uma2 family endonuclease
MAETDWHRKLMHDLIETLDERFAADSDVYVSGNLLVFYVPGDRLRHLSPDVFVVRGVPKRERPNFLTWEEGKGPDVVIELTSTSTRDEDVDDKFQLYQDTLRVPEYFLFDPLGDYLDPPLRGYRLTRGRYRAIRRIDGRLPSKVLGLYLEQRGRVLRLYDPSKERVLPTPREQVRREQTRATRAEERAGRAEERLTQTVAENERLRRELEELRRRRANGK